MWRKGGREEGKEGREGGREERMKEIRSLLEGHNRIDNTMRRYITSSHKPVTRPG